MHATNLTRIVGAMGLLALLVAALGFLHVLLLILFLVLLGIGMGMLGVFAVKQYNQLIVKENAIRERHSNIEVEEQRRLDLLENFKSSVLGSLYYERDRLAEVLGAIRRYPISVVFNLYPELRALERLRDLGGQIQAVEENLARIRIRYNEAVRAYDDTRRSFPANLILGWRFSPATYFSASPAARMGYRLTPPHIP